MVKGLFELTTVDIIGAEEFILSFQLKYSFEFWWKGHFEFTA